MEEHATYGTERHELPDYTERVQCQLPALHLLMQLGWQYLTPVECAKLRGERLGSTILEPILDRHIRDQCRFEFKGHISRAIELWSEIQEAGFTQEVEPNLERLEAMKAGINLFEQWAELA